MFYFNQTCSDNTLKWNMGGTKTYSSFVKTDASQKQNNPDIFKPQIFQTSFAYKCCKYMQLSGLT